MDRQWLLQIRKQMNLTQERVAELAEIERSHYTKIENGAQLSVKTAKNIADVLGFDWTLFF